MNQKTPQNPGHQAYFGRPQQTPGYSNFFMIHFFVNKTLSANEKVFKYKKGLPSIKIVLFVKTTVVQMQKHKKNDDIEFRDF